MIRKKKKFQWPRKLYDTKRIKDENVLVKKYGLKNKKEIWKTEAKLKYFRDRAKFLITAKEEDKTLFFNKLNKIGLNVRSVSDVLALNKEDLLKRRLSSIVYKKAFANTPKQARQMIVHKKIRIENEVVNVPGYLVGVDEETLISTKKKATKNKIGKINQGDLIER